MKKFNINIDIEYGESTFNVRAFGYPKREGTDIESIEIYSITDEYNMRLIPNDDQLKVFEDRCFELLSQIEFDHRFL